MPELLAAWVEALTRRRAEARAAEEAARGVHADARDEGHDVVLALLQRRAARLEAVRALLGDEAQVGFVLVLIPERLPIEETARAAHLLEEARVAVAGLVVNRVLPAAADGRFFEARKAQERTYLSEIDRRFSAFRRATIPQLESDVHNIQALGEIGRHLIPDA
jgi:arsenite-transporting ATPase